MNSLILRTAVPFLVGLMFLFSIYVLLRGHNEPGGGFIGGLIGASALAIYSISDGPAVVRQALVLPPIAIAGIGLTLAAISGLLSFFVGDAFLTGLWYIPEWAPDFKLISTVVLFDIGVYMVVVATIVAIAIALEESC